MGCGALVVVWALAIWQWGDPVTALYTRWEQRQLSSEYREIADTYRPRARNTGEPPPTPREVRRLADRMSSNLAVGAPIGRIVVDKLGVDMVVVNGTDTASLRKGPGRYVGSALPAQGELIYIAGHRTTFGAPFARIDRLENGDRVVLEMPYGTFTYAVTESVIVDAEDIDRLNSRGTEEVALQACHPRFSADQRYIVYARPVKDPTPSLP